MKVKNFTYGGTIFGSYFGWALPSILGWKSDFFISFAFSTLFGIGGILLGYYLYKFLRRKF